MAWFQVDDQLAMHRKVCEAGNAAMGLWVRAGSWSMQNLTEGYVPTKAARTLGTAGQARTLVSVGLWVEVEGGYQFHEWGTRQMSAEQIAERRRKRAEAGRKGGQSKAKPEANPEANASPNTEATPKQNHEQEPEQLPEQNRTPVPVPDLSVVTSGGNGTEPNAHDNPNDPPPETCPAHRNDPNPPACGACAGYRRRRASWNDQHADRTARQRAEFWAQVRECPYCDDRGMVDIDDAVTRCTEHDWSVIA